MNSSASFATSELPRLAYVGDVPVERSTHGAGLLYRLLEDYPSEKLLIVEGGPAGSQPRRRLPGVAYRQFALWPKRGRTRFTRLAATWLALSAASNAGRLQRLVCDFRPEAVLTVAERYTWLAGAQFAKDATLPLHLIIHDHWLSLLEVFPGIKPSFDRRFGRVYRHAASRLCVSPFMEEEYRHKYGVAGEVLYPSRHKDCPTFEGVPQTYNKNGGPLVGAYAGRILIAGYARLIADLAKGLEKRGGSLLLFGPHSSEDLKRWGLDMQNVSSQGLASPAELVSRLRERADFVFVPMAFDADGMDYNMRVGFPSKIVEYTATGLPLLLWGPEECSAVRWAQLHAPVAEVVTSKEVGKIDAALQRLEQAQHREQLGRAAAELGEKLFGYQSCVDTLFRVLVNGR
jgi:glycosyltransferase involved in cell wall biosynthesis